MAHYKDLRVSYAKNMEFHGIGSALFQPISAIDMTPPCCGYFDRNGDWNHITNLTTERAIEKREGYLPLAHAPLKVTDIGIEWQPKTTLGMQAYTIDGSGNLPSNLPAGAEAHIKYTSKKNFGAVLMTQKPITLTAYNDERLFLAWLDANKSRLYKAYGTELRRYGMWIVTRTHVAPGCSINAWIDDSKEAIVSLKAKAAMLGELGEELNWTDKLTDKDWCHYTAKGGDGLVVFMDGIQVKPSRWWIQGITENLPFGKDEEYLPPDRFADTRPRQPVSNPSGDQRYKYTPAVQERKAISIVRYIPERPAADYDDDDDEDDEKVLRDTGLGNPLSRSLSPRGSLSSYTASVRSPSLRRETRSISRGSNTEHA